MLPKCLLLLFLSFTLKKNATKVSFMLPDFSGMISEHIACIIPNLFLQFYFFLFRHYNRSASLPIRLQPESMEKMHCLRACVIRSLYHTYRPFVSRIARNPTIPEATPSSLKNSKVSNTLRRRITPLSISRFLSS